MIEAATLCGPPATVCTLRARSRLDYAWDNPRGTRRLRLRGCFRAPPAAMNAAAAAAMRAGVHGGAALAPKVDDARLHPYVSYRDVGAPQAAPASAATSSTTRRGQRSSLG